MPSQGCCELQIVILGAGLPSQPRLPSSLWALWGCCQQACQPWLQ